MTIHYEKHPVSDERKAELRAQGLTILDARFDPNPAPSPEPPKRRRKPREEVQGED